jgi:acetoin:2,6-dichlorophenolindophenol oxidoreductase subunit beta
MTTTVQGAREREAPSISMVAAVNQALDEAMGRDEKVIILGEDVADPVGGVVKATKGLSTKYGTNRVLATPISEQGFTGAGIGASLAGYRPVIEIMLMDFIAVCMDQIANHAAKLRYMTGGRTHVPITIRTYAGGGGGFGAQHSQSLEAWLMHTPGLKVVVPSTPADAKGLLTTCIFDDDPCVFMETMRLAFTPGPVSTEAPPIPLGVAEVKRAGTDVSVLTWGWQVREAMAAAEDLAGEGTSVEVVDVRSLVPLDRETILNSVAKTGRALVVHSSTQFAGPGAELAAMIQHELWGQLQGPVERLGAQYAPIPFASDLEAALFPERGRISELIRKLS